MAELLNHTPRFKELPATHRRSFVGQPRSILLPSRTVLFRFAKYAQERKDPGPLPSPFWLPKTTYEHVHQLHRDNDLRMADLARDTIAIAFDFKQTISGVMRARLCHATPAFRGTIAPHRMVGSGDSELAKHWSPRLRHVKAQGGLEQVYIPYLEWGDLIDVRVDPLSRKGSAFVLFSEA